MTEHCSLGCFPTSFAKVQLATRDSIKAFAGVPVTPIIIGEIYASPPWHLLKLVVATIVTIIVAATRGGPSLIGKLH
jgi:hypothetical protein